MIKFQNNILTILFKKERYNIMTTREKIKKLEERRDLIVEAMYDDLDSVLLDDMRLELDEIEQEINYLWQEDEAEMEYNKDKYWL